MRPAARLVLLLCAGVILQTAFGFGPAAAQTEAKGDRANRLAAESFVALLNRKNVAELVAKMDDVVHLRIQSWRDGPPRGLHLGDVVDTLASTPEEKRKMAADLVASVRIETVRAVRARMSDDVVFETFLRDAPPDWKALSLTLFVRGRGDVEHTALIGLNRANARIRGIYLN